MPQRRIILKFVHWLMLPLLIWFLIIGPPQAHALGPWGFQLHSLLAFLFVILCLAWTLDFIVRGVVTTRTPKLPPWAKTVHWWMHRTIIWGLFGVALGGFLLGLTAPQVLKAGLLVPIAPALNMPKIHSWVGFIHIMQFYALGGLIFVHAVFHIWRHFGLRDNALRIMAPRALHRFL